MLTTTFASKSGAYISLSRGGLLLITSFFLCRKLRNCQNQRGVVVKKAFKKGNYITVHFHGNCFLKVSILLNEIEENVLVLMDLPPSYIPTGRKYQ